MSRLGRMVVVVVLGLAGGMLTSYGQTYLPGAVRSLANSAGPWCAVAVLGAVVQRARLDAVMAGVLVLLALLAGYDVASVARGYPSSASTALSWIGAAVVVGPLLGLGRAGGALLGVVLVGEGLRGLAVLASSTSPVFWSIEIGCGVLVLGTLGQALLRGRRGDRSLGHRWSGPVREH